MFNSVCNFLPKIVTSSSVLLRLMLRWTSHMCLLWRQKVPWASDWLIRAACQQNGSLELKYPRSMTFNASLVCSPITWWLGSNQLKTSVSILGIFRIFQLLRMQIKPNYLADFIQPGSLCCMCERQQSLTRPSILKEFPQSGFWCLTVC